MTPSSRRPLVAGNWKMHATVPDALNLAAAIRQRLPPEPEAEVVLLPPYTAVWPVGQLLLEDPRLAVGAQDCYFEPEGAFTGQVSAAMLRGSCELVLVGHSERRRIFGDSDEVVRRKLEAGLAAGLTVLLAVGETGEERQAGSTEEVLVSQITAGLGGLAVENLQRCLLAYEPVWAIGAGKTASLEEIAETVGLIRRALDRVAAGLGDGFQVLYGGSVTGASAPEILGLEQVDGALVGGASLDADEFCAIVAAADGGRPG
ncbi:MAG: triose-phosphate isomerase [Candidatus Dormibacteria bacterium]